MVVDISRFGAIAQLGERLLCKQEVVGSIPSGSTIFCSCFLTVYGYRPCLARRRVFVACHSCSDMKARAVVTGRGRDSRQDAHEHIVRVAFGWPFFLTPNQVVCLDNK